MNSLTIAKTLSRPLLLASTAVLLHSGAALAADPSGHAQRLTKDLLSGSSASRSIGIAETIVRPDRESRATALDPQAQARAFIVGARRLGVKGQLVAVLEANTTAASTSVARTRRGDADAQHQAQRTLLGATG